MGKKPFPLPSSFPQSRGGALGAPAAALASGLGLGAAGRRGKREREREAQGVDSPLDFGEGGPQGGDSWRRAAARGSDHGGAAVGLAGGQGEEGE